MITSPKKNLLLLGIGVATLWLPMHYSFYRYTLADEGVSFQIILAFMALGTLACVRWHKALSAWFAKKPLALTLLAVLTLTTNGLLAWLQYLPVNLAVKSVVRYVLVAYYALVLVLLFSAWVRRLSDAMYQINIVAVIGAVGLAIFAVFFVTNLFYDTPVYRIVAVSCLAVSGLCWQLLPLGPVENEDELRFLPMPVTLRRWAMFFVAYVLVTALHSIIIFGYGATTDHPTYPMWLLHTALLLFTLLFTGVLLVSQKSFMDAWKVLTLVVYIVAVYYLGILSVMGAPGLMAEEGQLAALMVVLRTLGIFMFLVILYLCYEDSVAPISTFGLLFMLFDVVTVWACHILTPVLFSLLPYDPASISTSAAWIMGSVLIVVIGGFLLMYAWHVAGRVSVRRQAIRRREYAPLPRYDADAAGDGEGDGSASAVAGEATAVPPELSRRDVCVALGNEYGLTERESNVLYNLSLGFSAKKMAETMFISVNTVATHSKRIYRKLDVHSRQEVIDLVDELEGREVPAL